MVFCERMVYLRCCRHSRSRTAHGMAHGSEKSAAAGRIQSPGRNRAQRNARKILCWTLWVHVEDVGETFASYLLCSAGMNCVGLPLGPVWSAKLTSTCLTCPRPREASALPIVPRRRCTPAPPAQAEDDTNGRKSFAWLGCVFQQGGWFLAIW